MKNPKYRIDDQVMVSTININYGIIKKI